MDFKDTDRNLVDVRELARLLSIGTDKARDIGIKAGALIKIGRFNRYDIDTIMDYLRTEKGA